MKTRPGRQATLQCRVARKLGPDLVAANVVPVRLAVHAASCLRCQAEAARHRRLRRELAGLADLEDTAPAALAWRVERAIGSQLATSAQARHNVRVAAAVAGATAAAASAVALALWRRGRVAA